ncbi:MAG: MEDS domain-containing protein [Nitrososphaeraceae archaeon]|nr:MEDS domain-containing protein [Nitrososphaeraceae archaeon]
MDIERTLLGHVIGFPYYINSKSQDNNNADNEHIKDELEPSSIYRPLYEISNKYLENGYSVLYAAESLPNERDKAKVVEHISNVNNNNDDQVEYVRNDISRGLLSVINADVIYKDNASGKDIADFFISNVYEMHRKLQEKTKGTMICNMPDPYLSRGKYDVFMAFEEEIEKRLPENVGLLCWYKRRWLDDLSLAHAINVLANHRYTIHADGKYKQGNTNKIIDIISKGIDNNLGEGASVLLFETMKSAYKLNQNSIVHLPTSFEETLKKLLGKEDASLVIHSILAEILKQEGFTYT